MTAGKTTFDTYAGTIYRTAIMGSDLIETSRTVGMV